MDILKKLFELHFHAHVGRIVPLQGELGGSGRKITSNASFGAGAGTFGAGP